MLGIVVIFCIVVMILGAMFGTPEPDPAKRSTSEKLGRSAGKLCKKIVDYGNDD